MSRSPLVFVVISSVAVPILQLVSRRPWDSRWTALTVALYAVGVLLMLVIPRLAGSWARKMIRDERENDVNNMVSIVLLASQDGVLDELAVLRADETGLRFYGKSAVLLDVGWSDASALSVHAIVGTAAETIQILDDSQSIVARFLFMKPSGTHHVPGWKNDELLKQIAARRPQPRS